MSGFNRHIDHVNWVCRLTELERNAKQLEELCGCALQELAHEEYGFVMRMSWEAGVAIFAPLPERTDFNAALHDWLDEHGEGIRSITFGVASIDDEAERLQKLGYSVGFEISDAETSPWRAKINLRERMVDTVMNVTFTLGEIDYSDGVLDLR